MGAWLDRLAERRARGNTAKTDKTPAETTHQTAGGRVLSVLAVFERASSAEAEAGPVPADPFAGWRASNAERLTDEDRRRGYDAGGYCTSHGRRLSWPEQQRGACSWCVPVDPEREPAYWASHWRRFTERQ